MLDAPHQVCEDGGPLRPLLTVRVHPALLALAGERRWRWGRRRRWVQEGMEEVREEGLSGREMEEEVVNERGC